MIPKVKSVLELAQPVASFLLGSITSQQTNTNSSKQILRVLHFTYTASNIIRTLTVIATRAASLPSSGSNSSGSGNGCNKANEQACARARHYCYVVIVMVQQSCTVYFVTTHSPYSSAQQIHTQLLLRR